MEITIKYDYWLDLELKDYLSTLNGILDVKVDIDEDEIYIKYNNDITLKAILMEINLFLNLNNFPCIKEFYKSSDNILSNYTMIIKNLCCDHCLFSDIEDLLVINGIFSVSTNYNYDNDVDVEIYIKYDQNLVDLAYLKRLENEFNN